MTEREKGWLKQREFLRISTSIPAGLVCLTQEGSGAPEGWIEGRIVEIGGGGARIEMPLELAVGDVLCIRFQMPSGDDEMRVYGRVVAVSSRHRISSFCVKFVGLSEDERSVILRYIFSEQIRRAKQGKEEDLLPAHGMGSEDEGNN